MRGDEYSLNLASLDDFGQMVVHVEYTDAHEHIHLELLIVRDESLEDILIGLLVTDGLSQSHTSVLNAIDEYGQGVSVAISEVVEHLDNDSHEPHEHGSHHKDDYYLPCGHQLQIALCVPLEQIAQAYNDEHRQEIGESHTLQVNERREANHAGIGVENSEPYHAHE